MHLEIALRKFMLQRSVSVEVQWLAHTAFYQLSSYGKICAHQVLTDRLEVVIKWHKVRSAMSIGLLETEQLRQRSMPHRMGFIENEIQTEALDSSLSRQVRSF